MHYYNEKSIYNKIFDLQKKHKRKRKKRKKAVYTIAARVFWTREKMEMKFIKEKKNP